MKKSLWIMALIILVFAAYFLIKPASIQKAYELGEAGRSAYNEANYPLASDLYAKSLDVLRPKRIINKANSHSTEDQFKDPRAKQMYEDVLTGLAMSYVADEKPHAAIQIIDNEKFHSLYLNAVLFEAHLNAGNYSAVREMAKNYLRHNQDSSTLVSAAYTYLSEADLGEGMLESAVKNAEEATKVSDNSDEKYWGAYTQRAKVFIYAKKYDDAIAVLTDVLKERPSNTTAQYYLAKAYEESGQTRKALEAYKQVYQLKPIRKKYMDDTEKRIRHLSNKLRLS